MLEAGELAGDRFVDAVQALGAGQLVVEDVCPGIAPLCGGFLDLRGSAMQWADDLEDQLAGGQSRWIIQALQVVRWARRGGSGSPAAVSIGLRGHQTPSMHRASWQQRAGTHALQHLVAVVEIPQHGLNVGLVGSAGHEGQTPKLPLHSLHGDGGVQRAAACACV